MRITRPAPAIALAVTLLGASGCYSELDSEPARAPAETAEPETPPDPPSYGGGGGGSSTLGKAKETAKGTVSDLEKRDRELQKQLEDQ